MVAIDANVFVAASRLVEIHYATSKAFLERIKNCSARVFCPTLVIAETVAAIVRPTGDVSLALLSIRLISEYPRMTLLSLTQRQVRAAAHIAAVHRLRGADSVYVEVARESGATLVTWDNEMLQRAQGVVPVMTPADWLAANP